MKAELPEQRIASADAPPSRYGDPDQIAITRSIRADRALRMATADRWRVRRRRRSRPRHDNRGAGRLEAKPSRVLSYKDIREAHHILEAAEAGEEW